MRTIDQINRIAGAKEIVPSTNMADRSAMHESMIGLARETNSTLKIAMALAPQWIIYGAYVWDIEVDGRVHPGLYLSVEIYAKHINQWHVLIVPAREDYAVSGPSLLRFKENYKAYMHRENNFSSGTVVEGGVTGDDLIEWLQETVAGLEKVYSGRTVSAEITGYKKGDVIKEDSEIYHHNEASNLVNATRPLRFTLFAYVPIGDAKIKQINVLVEPWEEHSKFSDWLAGKAGIMAIEYQYLFDPEPIYTGFGAETSKHHFVHALPVKWDNNFPEQSITALEKAFKRLNENEKHEWMPEIFQRSTMLVKIGDDLRAY